MNTEQEGLFFRIVIGCFSHGAGHWSARDELLSNGLEDRQVCSVGSRNALRIGDDVHDASPRTARIGSMTVRCYPRQVRELALYVSSARLFDELWPAPHDHDGSLTPWMTPGQSDVLWRKLCEDCPLLMVSAESEQQQIRSSRIQLRHKPAVIQAFNFAA